MPDTQHGTEWEEEFASRLGAELRPGSGNKWYARGDEKLGKFLLSLKSTRNKNFTIEAADVQEIIDICEAPGGEDRIPGLAVRSSAFEVIAFRPVDFLDILTTPRPYVQQSKSDARRDAARKPVLFRDDD